MQEYQNLLTQLLLNPDLHADVKLPYSKPDDKPYPL